MSYRSAVARVVLGTGAALALAACDTSSPIAPRDPAEVSARSALMAVSAPVVNNFRVLYPATTLFGWCTGEAIVVSGELHVVITSWIGDETVRQRGHTNVKLAGIGLSTGRKYQLQEIANTDQEFSFTTPDATAEQVYHFNLISQGAAANAYITLNGTFRFSAGGVEFTPRKSEVVCR